MTTPSEGLNGQAPSALGPESQELKELEDELRRLGGVIGARVVGDRVGRPIEVHILSDQTKHAKQTVRDVRAVAQTIFGIEIDHRIVSVAQLDSAEAATGEAITVASAQPRVRVSRVHVDTEGVRAQVRVVLLEGTREHAGYAEGSIASVARPLLVATAALDAVRQMNARADAVHVASATIARAGSSRVAVVTVVYVEPPVELDVSGSAIVRQDRDEAVARALLDAVNRRLPRGAMNGNR